MEPPPPRPRTVTFLALVLGLLGAMGMTTSFLLLMPTAAEFPGGLGLALGVALIASNAALLVGGVMMWWMRDLGRRMAITGLALRMAHGLFFAFVPAHAAQRLPNLVSVAVLALLAVYLVRIRGSFAQ